MVNTRMSFNAAAKEGEKETEDESSTDGED